MQRTWMSGVCPGAQSWPTEQMEAAGAAPGGSWQAQEGKMRPWGCPWVACLAG